ncbi:Poly(A) polymerase papa [Cryomyces antarcticus]
MASQRQWGLTPPVSMAMPTEQDLALNDSLITELKDQNTFEGPDETERRANTLRILQRVTVEFVRFVGKKKGLATSVIDAAGGKVFTFGSYRLGVYGPGSDIDTLIVAPKHVSRDDFFENFPDLLAKASPPGAIEELTPVADAHVPIMKLEYSRISIDLIFARLAVSSVPVSLELTDKSLLRGLDETDLRSINGTRVTDEILQLVPQTKTFRHALRAVKLWAQRRAVYANVMGFPGGVAWAMLVARICQLYPQATGSVVLTKFFQLIASWPWPRPVMLKNIEDGPLQVRIWNPAIYPGDKRHLMPIITPAYPSMCATHNITWSTKKIITRELERAGQIANEISAGKKQWKDLFHRHTFFSQGYKYYLSVIAASRTKEAQNIWSGFVQSRVRRLVAGIEQSDAGVELAHPFTKGFERVHRCKNEEQVDLVLQGHLQFQATDIKTETTDQANDIMQAVAAQGAADNLEMPVGNGQEETKSDGITTIYTTTYYIGIELMKDAKSLDISYPVGDFKRQCTDWPQYNPDLNSIRIVHTRNYDLPADVFEPGENRPVRSKKGKSNKAALPVPKKRSFSNTGMEENKDPNGPKRRQPGNGIATLLPSNGTKTSLPGLQS